MYTSYWKPQRGHANQVKKSKKQIHGRQKYHLKNPVFRFLTNYVLVYTNILEGLTLNRLVPLEKSYLLKQIS